MTFSEKGYKKSRAIKVETKLACSRARCAFSTIKQMGKRTQRPQFLERRKFDEFCQKKG